MTTTIVVPLVGPPLDPELSSEQALPMARTIATRTGATVVLVSVIQILAELGGLPESVLDKPETLERQIAARNAYLTEIAKSFPNQHVHTIVRVGNPSDELLATVETFEDPLMVIASHARTGMRRFIMGSVAFGCVRRGWFPVMVVPVRPDPAPAADGQLNRLLIPIDGSPLAACVLDAALDALGPATLELHLVYVVEAVRTTFGLPRESVRGSEWTRAQRYLEELSRRLVLDGYRVTWEVCEGDPEQELARVAQESGTQLIAMATRGRSGLGRLLLGSVTEDIAALARIPLLIVRPSPEAIATVQRSTQVGRRSFQRSSDTRPIDVTLVRDVMVSPVITMTADTPLAEIANTMLECQIGAVVIVDSGGQLTGIVTESTLTCDRPQRGAGRQQRLTLFGQSLAHDGIERIYAASKTLTARQVMTSPVHTATEDEPISHVVARMIAHDINRVPVVRDGLPVGIVARSDLLKLLAHTDTGAVLREERVTT